LSSFLEIFDQHWAGRLQHRARTMRKALELLEQLPQPQSILETGCMRELPTDEAAKNDGCSTMLWDAYACHHDGRVFSCDIDEAKVQQAADHVSERVAFLVGDSVRRLWNVPGTGTAAVPRLVRFAMDKPAPVGVTSFGGNGFSVAVAATWLAGAH
jgi:hypothetical protein